MPVDHTGKYHMNPQVSRMHDAQSHPTIHHVELVPHGDGSHSVTIHKHDGSREGPTEHPSLKHAFGHIATAAGEKGAQSNAFDDAGEPGAEQSEGGY